MQVPVETMVIVVPLVPLVVQTPVVWLVKETESPDADVVALVVNVVRL